MNQQNLYRNQEPSKKQSRLGQNRPIYLDSPSTTPTDQRVFEKMKPFFVETFGNPHSKNHQFGWKAEEAVVQARQHIADFLRAEPSEIFFTSGATESNIISLRGIIDFFRYKKNIFPVTLLTSEIEHPSVLQTCAQLKEEGVNVIYLPVLSNGRLCLDTLQKVLATHFSAQSVQTAHKDNNGPIALLSVMAVNSETGVIQPLKEIGNLCRQHQIIFHSDATQALGKMPFSVKEYEVDLLSFSAHKIYGPKGIGGLFVRKGIRLRSPVIGAGQERYRGGTLPVPLCVGFGEACHILSQDFDQEVQRISQLSSQLLQGLMESIPCAQLNGDPLRKVPHILNISFPFVEGESIIMGLENIAVSTGSACSSDKLAPSHVLQAMKVDDMSIQSAVRFGLHRFTTQSDINTVLDRLPCVISKLRSLSPLWEMYQDGVDFQKIQWHE